MLVLGIETSCDETALALVEQGRKVLATQVASSLKAHQKYGGVVPEIASRAHLELFTYELESLLASAKVSPSQIDRIAVTCGPGLPGCLVVGVAAAKALALAWGKPVVGVNHLKAHLYAALLSEKPAWSLDAPAIGLVISGGHTALVRMEGFDTIQLLGATRDDAVGEAFDKVAKLLGLGFPGGPEIERVAKEGNPKAHRFSAPKMKSGARFDFSFSGIKTAVLYKIRELQKRTEDRGQRTEKANPAQMPSAFHPLSSERAADLAASFQASVIEEIVMKSIAAARVHRIPRLIVGGGVIANGPLRERLTSVCGDLKIQVAIPPFSLCTDNGAMVAGLGAHLTPRSMEELSVAPDLKVEMN